MRLATLLLFAVALIAGCPDDRRRGADGGSIAVDAGNFDAGPASCPDGGQDDACMCGDGCLATISCRDGVWECGGCTCVEL